VSKLLLVDGNAVLHRAYYALPDWRNREGEATAGVYGFLSMLLKALDELKPTHLVVVFDHPSPNFRHSLYVAYQATREKERQVSEDIWGQVEKLKTVLGKTGITVFQIEGFEADDVIGTLAGQANDSEVVIITGDKDLMQLVNEKVTLFMPQKGLSDGKLMDSAGVMEKMGVHPDQIVDYKALVGDPSDNYPGVAGIGPKSAIHLLAELGTLEDIYKTLTHNGGDLNEAVRNKLIDGYEAAKLSQQLATIRRDVPVTLNIEKSPVPETGKLADTLKELGYKSLVKRATGEIIKEDEKQTKLF
jgi:DNA polymerase-1